MRKVTFYIGQGFNKAGQAIPQELIQSREQEAFVYLIETFGGFTALYGIGGFKNGEGGTVEPTTAIVVLTEESDRSVENAGKHLREHFDQTEVVYTIEDAPQTFSI